MFDNPQSNKHMVSYMLYIAKKKFEKKLKGFCLKNVCERGNDNSGTVVTRTLFGYSNNLEAVYAECIGLLTTIKK